MLIDFMLLKILYFIMSEKFILKISFLYKPEIWIVAVLFVFSTILLVISKLLLIKYNFFFFLNMAIGLYSFICKIILLG